MDARVSASIAEAQAAQPLITAVPTSEDPDAPDEEAGVEIQVSIPGVEVGDGPRSAPHEAEAGTSGSAPPSGDDGPVWPDEAAESAMRVEVVSRGETLTSRAARELAEAAAEAAAEKKNLPPLDELIGKIPADVRDTLEDLFRVKFVKVARVPKKSLKG